MSSDDEQYCRYGDEHDQNIRIDSPLENSDYNRYSMYRMDEGEEGAVGYYGEGDELNLQHHHDVGDGDDVYAQLAQKEKDLILAAELGKALLESNEELRRKQEQIQHEYADKMETLEQERYELKLRLESIEGRYKDKMMDVQSEIMMLQKDLDNQSEAVRMAEKEKQGVVQELSEQNQRLTSQLQQAASTEEELTDQIQKLRLQLNDKKSSMTNNSHLLDRLREEVQLLTDRKCELERRLNALIEDRDSMACNLEEANDRAMMLERQVRESEQQLYNKDAQINELRQMNSHLQEKVEELTAQSLHQTTDSPSLFEELEESQLIMDTSDVEMEPRHGRYSVEDIESDEEVEDYGMVFSRPQSQAQDDFEKEQLKAINEEMKIMIHKSCSHLKEILKDLRRQFCLTLQDDEDDVVRRMLQQQDKIEEEDDNGGAESNDGDEDDDDEDDDDDFRPENLKEVIEEIKSTVQEIMQRQLTLSTASGISNMSLNRTKDDLAELENKIQSLELDLQSTQDHMGKLQTEISKQDCELERRSSVIEVLNAKARQSVADNASLLQLSDRERQVDMLQDERHRLQQHHQEDMIRKEENIQKAKAERDEAVAKKNTTELELTRAKIDMMNLDSQLLEAIQQKIELSQQLDQWQVDMEELLGIRMQKKLNEDKSNSTVITPSSRRKKKSFWS